MPPLSTSPWFSTVPDQRRFPSLSRSLSADVVVIGGGIAGVLTAWNLAASGCSVALLEKNHIATGDTGLTTAFLTRVPDAGAGALLNAYGAEWLTRLFGANAGAQRWFKDLVRQESIACDLVDCVSYNCSYESDDRELQMEWEAVRKADPQATFVSGAHASDTRVGSIRAAIRFADEARFDVRKLLFGLLARPTGQRIQLFEETEVVGVQVGERVTVQTTTGSVHCRSIVATTGFPMDAFAELQPLVRPFLTFAIAARYAGPPPVSDDLFWDTSEPYQYFRLFDGRTVILGGCDRAAVAAAGSGPPPHAALASFLQSRLGGPFDVTHQWSGSLFETSDGLPFIAEHPHYRSRVFVATGFGGNGMVMGTLAGRLLADLALGVQNESASLFDFSRTGATVAASDATGVHAPADAFARGASLSGANGGSADPAHPTFVRVAGIAEIAPGQGRAVKAGKVTIAIFNIGGRFHAIDNACTHAGGSLCDGRLDGAVVECPLHGSKFDVTTGAVRQGPASRPQRSYPVRVNGDALEIQI